MKRIALLLALLATPATAEVAAINCVGALQLEDDVFSVPFARGSARVTEADRSALAAVVAAMGTDPSRVACVLGHAGQEGGATTSIRLAAERARAVATALAGLGISRDRLRTEARSAQFSPRVRAETPPSRTVTVVVLPASAPPPPPAAPQAAEPAPESPPAQVP
jgi:outer membrane protein OmpA-like peptidoglycan-associated protein